MKNDLFSEKIVRDDVLLVNPGKVLDNNNAHHMVQKILDAQTRGFRFLIVDCSELEFLSSAGVGSVLGTIELYRENGGDIILCNLSVGIVHILKVLDLYDFLTVKKNDTEAIASCAAR